MAPLEKILECQDEHPPNQRVKERYDNVNRGEGQPAIAKRPDVPQEYASHSIVRQLDDGNHIKYVVRWYRYRDVSETVELA